MDTERKAPEIIELKDEDMNGSSPDSDSSLTISLEKTEEIGKDPESALRALHGEIERINKGKGIVLSGKLLQGFFVMFRNLDNTLDSTERAELSKHAAESLSGTEVEVLTWISTQKPEDMSGIGILAEIMAQISGDKIEDPGPRIDETPKEEKPVGGSVGLTKPESGTPVHDGTPTTDSQAPPQEGIEKKKADEEMAKKAARLKEGIARLLKGDREAFMDAELMENLPGIMGQQLLKGEYSIPDKIMAGLAKKLFSDDADMRLQISETLANIIDKVPPERRQDSLKELSEDLMAWLRLEASPTGPYQRICKRLSNLVQWMLLRYQFDECMPILEALADLYPKEAKEDDPLESFLADILGDLATPEIIDLLLKESRTNANKARNEAEQCLSLLGLSAAGYLLDLLHETGDGPDRERLVRVLSGMGPLLVPVLRERIKLGGRRNYLHDLTLILGEVGSEADLEVLEQLLSHDDPRICLAALNSVCNIDGDLKGEVLLSFLPSADDELKTKIVKMLGTLKHENAVQPLIDLLKSKPFFASEGRDELEETICKALGSIGTEGAAEALNSVCGKKAFWSTKPFSKNVQFAAKKALQQMGRKQTE